jgi:hypothetical protein
MSTKTTDDVVEAIRADLAQVEEKVLTPSLSDLMRAGSQHTEQKYGWGHGGGACALSAAALGAAALGVISTGR